MDPRNLELAAEVCNLVGSDDLLSYLGLTADTTAEEARAALKKKRGFFQSMQGNPKYRDVAKLFIKHYRGLDAVLGDPAAYAAHARKQRASAQLPMLEIVIDGVLADGVLTPEEEAFVRENAVALGIAVELYEEILRERCAAAGIAMPDRPPAPPPPVPGGASITPSVAPSAPPAPKRHKGAATQGWWDESFSKLLVSAVPDDTRRLVDLATGMGWGALAILPERPALEYLGIDRDAERLQLAEKAVRSSAVRDRVALMPGKAHELPIPDGAVDVVLCVRALDRVPSVGPVLAEAARILRPGGQLICVEPDRAALRLWFDGPLAEVEAAFSTLARRVDAALAEGLSPADAPGVSLGPCLGERMREVGLRPSKLELHPVREARLEDMEGFAERLSGQVQKLAQVGRLGGRAPEVAAAMHAIDAAEDRIGSAVVGLAASLLPLFLVVGTKG